MEFVEILEDIMDDLKLNQTELANKMGIKQSQVSEWLKPGYDSLKLFCVKLGISQVDYSVWKIKKLYKNR